MLAGKEFPTQSDESARRPLTHTLNLWPELSPYSNPVHVAPASRALCLLSLYQLFAFLEDLTQPSHPAFESKWLATLLAAALPHQPASAPLVGVLFHVITSLESHPHPFFLRKPYPPHLMKTHLPHTVPCCVERSLHLV